MSKERFCLVLAWTFYALAFAEHVFRRDVPVASYDMALGCFWLLMANRNRGVTITIEDGK